LKNALESDHVTKANYNFTR